MIILLKYYWLLLCENASGKKMTSLTSPKKLRYDEAKVEFHNRVIFGRKVVMNQMEQGRKTKHKPVPA